MFVGYQTEGTRGRRLQEGEPDIKMFGELVPVAKPGAATHDGVAFLKTTGAGSRYGTPMRYQALAAQHRGHVLLVYSSGDPSGIRGTPERSAPHSAQHGRYKNRGRRTS